MNNLKLINILRTFSKNEIKEFEKFISSPFFNGGRNYMPFFNQIKKFYPKFDNEKMTPEHIYSKVYPGKEFNKQILWNITSQMLAMAEDFLIYVSLRKNKFLREKQVAGEFHNRNLLQYFSKKLDEMENELEDLGLNPAYFLFKMQLEASKKEYFFLEGQKSQMISCDDKEGEYAAHYFLWSILRVLNDMKVHSYMYNASYDLNLTNEFVRNLQLENIINYCKEKKYKFTWLFEMYYNYNMMLQASNGDEFFFKLKELFDSNYRKFTDDAKFGWTACLMNYCSAMIYKQALSKNSKFKKILFEIQKFELKEGSSVHGRYLSKTHFLLILKNALAINETAWIKSFIEEFVPKLKPSHQKSMKAFGLASLHLKLKNYDKVYESLARARFNDVKDRMAVKLIYLKAYYETNQVEVLLSLIDTTVHFIKNNSALIPSDIAANYLSGLKYIKKLITMKEKDDYSEADYIRKKIESETDLLLGEWLLEKIDELNKRHVLR